MEENAPEVAVIKPELEVDHRPRPDENNHKYIYEAPQRRDGSIPWSRRSVKRGCVFLPGLIFGFSIAAAILGAALGGKLGADLSHCHAQVKELEGSATTIVSTAVSVTASSASVTSTVLLENYIPINATTIDTVHDDCDSKQPLTNQYDDTYFPLCGTDLGTLNAASEGGIVADIMGILAYSFLDCMNACSNLNERAKMWGFPTKCLAITFRVDMKNATYFDRANCWLKNGTSDILSIFTNPNWHSAKLASVPS